ncbi:MAG TPA: glycoside hydrolase family 38 C-terminal domain-containing protein [Verrucomicrobiae bacterium]|nr:glycoside hydrolase family 38 C-terminal domain-containing protein [Verrucomicrobiae bacterium]
MPLSPRISRRSFVAAAMLAAARAQNRRRVFVIPNFHPASCGWLTNFSMERVYCANSYFDHLDRVRDDPNYSFVLSECNNMIAMMNFRPERTAELKSAIRAGRVELVNGFFLESTVNLSGGEALVRLGIEGLRFQQEVFGVRPRFAWCIDVCGTHPQMAQITAGLGLDALVYTRGNTTGSAIHWLDAPDGTRVLAIAPGHYSDLGNIFAATGPMTVAQIAALKKQLEDRTRITPTGAPVLAIGGNGDYNLAPKRADYPSGFLREWQEIDPFTEFRFTTLAKYLDEVAPQLKVGTMKIPVMRGGTGYFFHSFWIECPKVKMAYRRCEHALQAAEMLASAASLKTNYVYPAESLYHSWLQMFLNMDRNTLWGAAGGMVFENETSWDAADRFRHVAAASRTVLQQAGKALAGTRTGTALFNPLNWRRQDPVILAATEVPAGVVAEALEGSMALCRPSLEATSLTAGRGVTARPEAPHPIALPDQVENRFFAATIDAASGALVSLKLKPSGMELLGGPGNVLVAERPRTQQGDPGDFMLFREQRNRLGTSSDSPVQVSAMRGPLATTITCEGSFIGGGACRRIVRFYHDSPRIDFETTLNDIPDRTVVVAEFPLAEEVSEVRRGIPYGFTHGAWPEPTEALPGWSKGIVPAVRWSHCTLRGGGGFAIFDRGLSGRELTGKTPVIFLLNTTNKYYGYPNAWLSGEGRHVLEYAIMAHHGAWEAARIPQMAWEYNCPPYPVGGGGARPGSFLQTSGNVIVEAMRRDRDYLEVRLAECFGRPGTAHLTLALPHHSAALTNLTGGAPKPLAGGPRYEFPVRAQQIVTLRFRTSGNVSSPKPLLDWAPLVPPAKRAMLSRYSNEKGHPPRGV